MELGGFYVKFERVLLENGGKFMDKNIKNKARLNLIKIRAKSTPNLT